MTTTGCALIPLTFIVFFVLSCALLLDSSFVPPLLYAVFGSSNNLAVGTVAAASLLLASIVEAEVPRDDNPELYLQIFYTAAFFTGVIQTALGVFRYVTVRHDPSL